MKEENGVINFVLLITILFAVTITLPVVVSQVTFPMRIVGARTLDEEGKPTTDFERGQLVLVEATVVCPFEYYAPPEYKFLFIVKFVDSWGVTFYYGVVYGRLVPGQSATYAVGGKIPEGAPIGTYKAVIYVWSNWPAYERPTVYTEAVEVTFKVQP